MARIRSIKPEFWSDFDTAQHSRDARLLYVGLWNFCDEHARMPGDPRFVKGHIFPYDDDLGADAIDALLDELATARKVVRYQANGAPYLYLPALARHQRLEANKVPSRLPPPPDGPPSESRADESAPGADESPPSYVAGGREHAAGSRARADAHEPPQPQPVETRQLPGEVAILRSKLNARRLQVRWDKLTSEQLDEIASLVETHGDAALIQQALRSFRPDNPPVFAQAWLDGWRQLTPPGELHEVRPRCPYHPHDPNQHDGDCRPCDSERLAGER